MKFLAVCTIFPLLRHSIAQQLIQNGLLVETAQGTVNGSLVAPGVRRFLGIPFATAGRWKAPQPPLLRGHVLQATSFGDSCFQDLIPANVEFSKLTSQGGLDVPTSEDCLNVNIWAPAVDRKQGTAVLIWVYGGNFVCGTSNLAIYNGQNFVRDNEDITIVTFNYRLGIFGQPNAPQLVNSTKAQNFGLLDIDAAIQWVHANIANFGGDPNRITIFGQSAGSAAVDLYTFSHPHDTVVKGRSTQNLHMICNKLTVALGVIQESGTAGLVLNTPPGGFSAWSAVANAVGCGNNTSAQQLTCMQSVTAKALQVAMINTEASFPLVADNITVFDDTAQRAAEGNFLRVPLLGGTNLNEDDVFIVGQQLITPPGTVVPTLTEVVSDLNTLIAFTCRAGSTAINRINVGVPTWRYQYQAVFPDISSRPDLRAYHTSEIPIVFGTYNQTGPASATVTEVALSRYVQSAWVAFARDPARGLLTEFGWPLYNPNTTSLIQIGNPANETGMVLTKGSLIDMACADQAILGQMLGQLTNLL